MCTWTSFKWCDANVFVYLYLTDYAPGCVVALNVESNELFFRTLSKMKYQICMVNSVIVYGPSEVNMDQHGPTHAVPCWHIDYKKKYNECYPMMLNKISKTNLYWTVIL